MTLEEHGVQQGNNITATEPSGLRDVGDENGTGPGDAPLIPAQAMTEIEGMGSADAGLTEPHERGNDGTRGGATDDDSTADVRAILDSVRQESEELRRQVERLQESERSIQSQLETYQSRHTNRENQERFRRDLEGEGWPVRYADRYARDVADLSTRMEEQFRELSNSLTDRQRDSDRVTDNGAGRSVRGNDQNTARFEDRIASLERQLREAQVPPQVFDSGQGSIGASDKEFMRSFSSGDLSLSSENVERAARIIGLDGYRPM